MNPDQILAALAAVYAECASYRDTGEVVTRFLTPVRRPRTDAKPFQTAFIRPDRFRFEYRHRYSEHDDWDRHIVWAGGADVRVWWDTTPGVERLESLALALAGATGVSGGSAHTIPALLLPDIVGGRRLTDLVDLASAGDEELDGVACYRLSGRLPEYPLDPGEEERRREEVRRLTGRELQRAEHSPVTVWVDRGTFLVRRIEAHTRFETFSTEKVTTYRSEADVAVGSEELRFDPPDQPGG